MNRSETAILGGGCFWCIEAVFDDLDGVLSVDSGYSGGMLANPGYEQVCTGKTGHAEVVRVNFDPDKISFSDILRVFFTVHDPTTLNRQGNDVGTQYRSVIFYRDSEQKRACEEIMHEIETANIWDKPLVTELSPFKEFFPAENYHQEYFANNPDKAYCRLVVAPKLEKFRKLYRDRLKKNRSN